MTIRGYQLAIDWSRQGTFANTLEDVTTPGDGILSSTELVVSWGRDAAKANEDSTAGQLTFALNNHERQFSPENTASPIAGQVLPGTRARLQVTTGGMITTLFDGPIDTFTVDPNATAKTFTATALDGWGVPGSEKLSTQVYSGMRTGDLINVVLDQIGWDPGMRDIDPGATLVDWWWVEGSDATTAVNDLVHSEGPPAIAYVLGGVFIFRDRHHRLLRSQSTTSQALYTQISPAGTGPSNDFKIDKQSFNYDHGLTDIINSVSFAITRRTPGNPVAVWNTDSPISLDPGATVQLIVQASDPFIFAQTPQPFVYDNDGNPISGEYAITGGSIASITLSRDNGQTCIMTITAGGGGAFLPSGIALTATPLSQTPTVQVTAEDQSSINLFRIQNGPDSPPWCNPYDAQAIADKTVAVYAGARPTITFSVTTSLSSPTAARYLASMLARSIGDRVTIRHDEMGINDDYMVERVAHTVTKLGAKHKIEIGVQVADPVQPSTVFQFDTSGQGFDQGSFGVDGITDATTMFQFDTAGHGFDQGRFAV